MVLPHINMNPPRIHTRSPPWTPLLPPACPTPPLRVIPVHQPRASRIMHRTWTGDSFHIWYYTCFNAILPNHPTLVLSHRVQETALYICVSPAVSHTGPSLPFLQTPYICVSILYWCFSFWPTSLCIIGSSFIFYIPRDPSFSLPNLYVYEFKIEPSEFPFQKVAAFAKPTYPCPFLSTVYISLVLTGLVIFFSISPSVLENFLSFSFYFFILAALGLCCYTRAFSDAVSGGYSPVAVRGLLTVAASLVEHKLWGTGFSGCGTWP